MESSKPINKQPYNPLESPEGRPTMTLDLHDGTNEQISIIIPSHNRPDFLNMCVQSIHTMSNMNNYEVIIVDNNSGRETQEYLDVLQEEGIKVIRNSQNNYWSKACNQGAAAADPYSKFLLFMHADTIVLDPAWLDVLVNISVGRQSGMVGTQLGHYTISRTKADFIQEWCVLFSRQCWNDIGQWPEELPLIGMSYIMTLKAQLKGYKPQATGNNIVHHYKAFSMDPNEYERLSEQAMASIGKLILQIQNG